MAADSICGVPKVVVTVNLPFLFYSLLHVVCNNNNGIVIICSFLQTFIVKLEQGACCECIVLISNIYGSYFIGSN